MSKFVFVAFFRAVTLETTFKRIRAFLWQAVKLDCGQGFGEREKKLKISYTVLWNFVCGAYIFRWIRKIANSDH